MPRRLALLALLLFAAPLPAALPRLTPKEVEDGWIELFDGETAFGWQVAGKGAKLDVKDGVLTLTAGAEPATAAYVGPTPSAFEFVVDGKGLQPVYQESPVFTIDRGNTPDPIRATAVKTAGKWKLQWVIRPQVELGIDVAIGQTPPVAFNAFTNERYELKSLKIRPLDTKPLFRDGSKRGWVHSLRR